MPFVYKPPNVWYPVTAACTDQDTEYSKARSEVSFLHTVQIAEGPWPCRDSHWAMCWNKITKNTESVPALKELIVKLGLILTGDEADYILFD